MSVTAASCVQNAAGAAALVSARSSGSGEAYRALAASCAAASGAGASGAAAIATPSECLLEALPGSGAAVISMELAGAATGDPRIEAALSLLRAFASSGRGKAAASSRDGALSDLQQALKLLQSSASQTQSAQAQAASARTATPDPAFIPFARGLAAAARRSAVILRRKKSFTKRRREEREREESEARRDGAEASGFYTSFTFSGTAA